MKLLYQIPALALAATTLATPTKRAPDIVGGQDAKIEDFPYQTSLQHQNAHICGGIIIGKDHILTAAHCIINELNLDRKKFSIRAGSTSWSTGGQAIAVANITTHPGYTGEDTLSNDIAVLTLASELNLGKGVAVADLPSTAEGLPKTGTKVVVSGWGLTAEQGHVHPTLRSVGFSVVDKQSCAKTFSWGTDLTEDMFCAGDLAGGHSACQGDSGGPLYDVDGKKVVGVVSWGFGCARRDYPDVYESVAFYRAFIKSVSGI